MLGHESIHDVIMPDIAPFEYLVRLISEIGPFEISWLDLKVWQEMTGIYLSHWEFQNIKRLSSLFSSKFQDYNDSNISSPYRDVDVPSLDQKALQSMLRDDQRFKKNG